MAPTKTGLAGWYARIAAFNVEDLFSRKREPGPPRTVFVNQNLPPDYLDHKGRVRSEHVYTSNQVITSKYTIITFIPRNLLEQFRRIANIYFLGIAVLQFFPKFSTIAPGVVILPLIIIIVITGLKDGYEDVKRHQSDRRVNHSKVKVLSEDYWSNPNAMQGKSRTFVRGLVPKGSKLPSLQNLFKRALNAGEELSRTPETEIDYDEVNERDRFPDGKTMPHWKNVIWEDVRVGDFVKLYNDEPLPADILICATSEDENIAFVETKNLDGETNLKSRNAVPALTHLRTAAACADSRTSFQVKCDRPDTNMYRLNGNVAIDEDVSPVDLSMTLLRGTVLRNTEWVIGVVMYTGLDTKIVLNSGVTPSKRSKVERQMNPQVFINLLLLAAMATVCAIVDSSLERQYFPLGAPWLYGDDLSDDNPRINGLVTWAFSLLTFQDIVPISLYISIEFVRTCQAAFIYFDADIWYEKTNQATIARSWNLSDDLGQIEYIFSDKTGTLTQNLMVFRQCSIGGRAYRGDPEIAGDDRDLDEVKASSIIDGQPVNVDLWRTSAQSSNGTATTEHQGTTNKQSKDGFHFRDSLLQEDLEEAHNPDAEPESAAHSRLLNGFFTVLSLCHTVLTSVDPVTGEIQYKSQSPDEAALVQAAADVGFVFQGKDKDILTLKTPAEVEKYELLNILEFTSARKRMSVVLRKLGGDDNRLFLLTKGADNVIFERLKSGGEDLKRETEQHLNEFANGGLRTLTLAFKVINEDEYETWNHRYHDAIVAMDDREAKIEAVCNELETNLRLLGATAIEDRLQDGVPEAIADLKRAGIKIWVATGDKLETAIAIGRSTNLVEPDSNVIIVRGNNQGHPVLRQIRHAMEKYFPDSEVVAPGARLPRSSTSSRDGDRNIPLQRIDTSVSSIAGSGNGERPGGFVLVIDGDALLDVFSDENNKSLMLQLATLCEGVICCRVSPLQKALIVKLVKEGLGAMTLAIGDGANDVSMIQAADVGVGISGEEGLQAVNSSDYAIAQFRFLKKLLLVHGHWSYARNGTMLSNFFYKNIVPTGILWWFQIYSAWSGYYVFDYTYILFWNSLWTIAPLSGLAFLTGSRVLMELPELYHYGRKGYWFGIKQFLIFMFDGVVQSAVIFFITLYTYTSTTSRTDGYDVYIYEFSTTMAVSAVMVANMFTGFTATAWTAWLFFAVFVGIVMVWLFTAIYAAIVPANTVTALYGNNHYLFTSAYFWLCLPITFLVALAPRYLAKAWKFGFSPDDIDTVRWIRKNDPHRNLATKYPPSGLAAMRRPSSAASRRSSHDSVASIGRMPTRPSMDIRSASRTDMSTGIVSVDRGFDFMTEENGVAMRRIQTNLSERRFGSRELVDSSQSPKGKSSRSRMFSLRRSLLKRKAS
ncbi:hypothetical protein BD779DRAFT_1514830 [Infundibulicybe gibba]|nr:hypothetical protein BD779DRAFT_1514830 [Infundibulicybe gibba]